MFCGISSTLFDQLVADGRMPRARRINGRKVWRPRWHKPERSKGHSPCQAVLVLNRQFQRELINAEAPEAKF
jgi:hypothetical protein